MDKVMPQYSREDEEALIGSAMINPQYLDETMTEPEEFHIIKNQWVWDVLLSLRQAGTDIDGVTITTELDNRGLLADVGGAGYITELMMASPSSLHAPSYAKSIRDNYDRRLWVLDAQRQLKDAFDHTKPVIDSKAAAATRLMETSRYTGGAITGRAFLKEGWDMLEEWAKNPGTFAGISTGLVDLDKCFGKGLLPGLNLLLGEPGLGKTILAQQMFINMVKAGEGCVFYQSEMDKRDFYLRIMSDLADIKVSELREGDIDFTKVIEAEEGMADHNFHIDTPRGMTTAELRVDLLRLKRDHRVKVVFFDYLDYLKDFEGKVEGWRRSEILAERIQDILVDLDMVGLFIHEVTKKGMGEPGMSGIAGGKKVAYRAVCAVQILQHVSEGEPDIDMRSIQNIKPPRLIEGYREWCDLYKNPLYPRFENAMNSIRQIDMSSAINPDREIKSNG